MGTGYATNPGLVEEFVVVATEVSGPSSAWAEVTFDLPVAASLSDLYVAFELPAQVILTARGLGGGPAVGYVDGPGGLPGWLSGEGEIWAQLHEDYSFAVLPRFVAREEGMLVKSLGDAQIEAVPDAAEVVSDYLVAGPNPFNPQTEIRFGLTGSRLCASMCSTSGVGWWCGCGTAFSLGAITGLRGRVRTTRGERWPAACTSLN